MFWDILLKSFPILIIIKVYCLIKGVDTLPLAFVVEFKTLLINIIVQTWRFLSWTKLSDYNSTTLFLIRVVADTVTATRSRHLLWNQLWAALAFVRRQLYTAHARTHTNTPECVEIYKSPRILSLEGTLSVSVFQFMICGFTLGTESRCFWLLQRVMGLNSRMPDSP